MGRAAVAEEAVGIGVGVEVEGLDLVDSCGDQTVDDIGFEVEVRLSGEARHEKAFIITVSLEKSGAERLVDLIGGLADAGSDRGGVSR